MPARTPRHYLSVLDLSAAETEEVLALAARLKRERAQGVPHPLLAGKSLAMVFQKPSLRTRVSFEAGMDQLGGRAIVLGPDEIRLGERETVEDVALVLSRLVDLVMARVFAHAVVEELARHATVPVINGLSDREHPCQILGDLLTIRERRGRISGVRGVFVGDGNNVAHSLLYGAALLGMHLTVVTPPGHAPLADVVERAAGLGRETGSRIRLEHDPAVGMAGAEVVYTDVWASMGRESEAAERRRAFAPYQVDAGAMARAASGATLLHCLPAHYGEEIDYAVSRMPNAALFDQAENRLHAQKALLVTLSGAGSTPARRRAPGRPFARPGGNQ